MKTNFKFGQHNDESKKVKVDDQILHPSTKFINLTSEMLSTHFPTSGPFSQEKQAEFLRQTTY